MNVNAQYENTLFSRAGIDIKEGAICLGIIVAIFGGLVGFFSAVGLTIDAITQ